MRYKLLDVAGGLYVGAAGLAGGGCPGRNRRCAVLDWDRMLPAVGGADISCFTDSSRIGRATVMWGLDDICVFVFFLPVIRIF